MVQRAPVPVDVVTTPWDYFVDTVGVVSGLTTAGALIYAARTYQRQVDDAQRGEASKMSLRITSAGDNVLVSMSNGSDQTMRKLVLEIRTHGPGRLATNLPNQEYEYIYGHDIRTVPPIKGFDKDHVFATLTFTDSTGRRWSITSYGLLYRRYGIGLLPRARRVLIQSRQGWSDASWVP